MERGQRGLPLLICCTKPVIELPSVCVIRQGIVSQDRTDLNASQTGSWPASQSGSLADALQGADVFLGVSAPGVVTPEMVRIHGHLTPSCLPWPIPFPEIQPELIQTDAGGHCHGAQ